MKGDVPGEVFCFGRFTLDPVERRLRIDGAPVSIGSTAFNVLVALVERAGSVVAKEELISRVWGYADVGDNRVYVHINALRKVFGKNCIVTKNARGYRFETQVHRISRLPQSAASQQGNISSFWGAAERPNRLIGRSEQLELLSDLISHGRLVTLTGTGGVGKTSLALEAAKQASLMFCDGAWLVELAPLNDPQLVASTVASALGAKIGVNASPLDAITRYLASKSLLIVLDNCEHVIAAVVALSEAVLAGAPGVKILTTSREPLSCYGEQVVEVLPLAVPWETTMEAATLRAMPSVELFIERARDADATFQVDDEILPGVARICRRVDGLPLAIEMVASWAGPLGIETLAAKLDETLSACLRTRNTAAPQRHSTLGATLGWSYSLLSVAEQLVLCRVATFASSFTMSAAEVVAAGDSIPKLHVFEHITSLVRKSMIRATPGPRFQQYHLLETTRAFALEKLADAGNGGEARNRHAHYVLNVLEPASIELETTGDAVWLERYGAIIDDLRVALDWAVGENSDHAVALAGAAWPIWRQLSLRAEGRQRLNAAARLLRPGTPEALEARLWRGLGEMVLNTEAMKDAHNELERAVNLYRRLDDAPNLGSALAALAFSLLTVNRLEEAEQAVHEALSLLEPAGWLRTLAMAHNTQMCIDTGRGRFQAARVAHHKAMRVCEMAGADRTGFAIAANWVQFTFQSGNLDDAILTGRELAARLEKTPHADLRGFVLGILTGALTERGDLKEALTTAREAAPLLRDSSILFWLFDHLALRAGLAGRSADAALILGYTNTIHEKFGRPRESLGCHALERAASLVRDSLPDEEIVLLSRLGAGLSEDQVLVIALSDLNSTQWSQSMEV